jgi:ketosteroid isomerase-like protein
VQCAPGWQEERALPEGFRAVLDETIRRYIASYNDRDIDAMLACVTDDVVFENISNAGQSMRLDGKAMMRQVAEVSGNAFSYRRQRLINIVTGSGKAAAEIEFEGRAAVDLPNGVRAGETVRVRGASFFEFRGALLCRIADYS